jgi:hypothetical protein
LTKKVVVYAILFVAALAFILWYFPIFSINGLPKNTMMLAFLTKLTVGLLLIYMHNATYKSKTLSHDGPTFLREGKTLNDVFYDSPKYYFQLMLGIEDSQAFAYKTGYWSPGDLTLINDSKNVIRLHAIIHFFSANQILIHLAIFCLLALLGTKLLFQSLKKYIKINPQLAFWLLLIPPSTIFWTSSLMKESILMLGIGLFSFGVLADLNYRKRILYISLSIPFLIGFKPYVGLLMVMALLYIFWAKFLFKDKHYFALPAAVLAVLIFSIFLQETRNKVVNHLTRKQFDFINVGRGGLHVLSDTCFYFFSPEQYDRLSIKGTYVKLLKETDAFILRFGSTQQPIPVHLTPKGETWKRVYQAPGCESFIQITPINNSGMQLIKNIPEALVNGLFRPFPTDPGSKLKYLAIIEIFGMLCLTFYAVLNRRKLNIFENRIVTYLIVFSIGLLLLIGWTTPVNGAIVRYRFPVQLATVIAILILLKPLNFKFWKNT